MEGGRSMRRQVLATLAISMVVASGCDPNARDAVPMAEERSVAAPSTVAYELPARVAALDANPAPSTNVPAAPNVSVDARILVVTASGSSGGLDAIHQILGFLGTPHDILDATSGPALTADFLATDDHGKYQAIFLDLDDLSVSGASAFTDDEWKVLSAYEAKFSVRRVALYGTGTAAYGLTHGGAAVDTGSTPLPTHCTDAGRTCSSAPIAPPRSSSGRAGLTPPPPSTAIRRPCSWTTPATSTPRSAPTPTDGRPWRSPSRSRPWRRTPWSSATRSFVGPRAACSWASGRWCSRRSSMTSFWPARSIHVRARPIGSPTPTFSHLPTGRLPGARRIRVWRTCASPSPPTVMARGPEPRIPWCPRRSTSRRPSPGSTTPGITSTWTP